MPFEPVYTVWKYWDRPREGIAEFAGHAHFYKNHWSDSADDYADTYSLIPLDDETLVLSLEQWNIWRKWLSSSRERNVPPSSHPAFGGIDPRFDELAAFLDKRIAGIPPLAGLVTATFRSIAGVTESYQGWLNNLEVQWTAV